MKKSLLFSIVATFLFITATTQSNAQTITQPYVDINTGVQREVTPDELYLKITISEKEYKGKKSLEELQSAMIGALKENRIDIPECLTLNYMGSEIGYKTFSKKVVAKTEATYILKLSDATIMQQVIASLEARQISNIELAKVKYTKEKELKNGLATEAMQQAKAEAAVLAGAIGQEIGKATKIESWLNSSQVQPRLYKARSVMNDAANVEESSAATPAISIGKITYNFNVSVRFELK